MWFKGFIVAALTAALAVGPFAGRVAKADPTSLELPELTAQIVNDAATELLESIMLGEATNGPMNPGHTLADMLSALDVATDTLVGRPRHSHEAAFLGGTPVGMQYPIHIDGQQVTLTIVQVVEVFDLGDKSAYEAIDAAGLAAFVGNYSSARRMTALLTSAGGGVIADLVEISGAMPGLPASLYFTLGVDTDLAQAPGSTLSPLASWRCVLYSAGAAAAMTACFACVPTCVTFVGCACAYSTCCASYTFVMRAVRHCNGQVPAAGGGWELFNEIVDAFCAF